MCNRASEDALSEVVQAQILQDLEGVVRAGLGRHQGDFMEEVRLEGKYTGRVPGLGKLTSLTSFAWKAHFKEG